MSLKDDLARMDAEDERLPDGEFIVAPCSDSQFHVKHMTAGGYVLSDDWNACAQFVASARTDRPALVKMVRLLSDALRTQYMKRASDSGNDYTDAEESARRHVDLLWSEATRKK